MFTVNKEEEKTVYFDYYLAECAQETTSASKPELEAGEGKKKIK